jgi:hypothetical protein
MSKGIFEQLYSATEEVLKKMQKPLVERKLKRKQQSALDDAENRKILAEEKLNKARKEFDNYDINDILRAKKEIKTCEELATEIRKEYKEYFGEELT